MATSNQSRFSTQVMLDIEDEVDTDSLMITWRLSASPHIAKCVAFGNLIHFTTNRELPEVIIIVLVNSECMVSVSWRTGSSPA
jgi:hypothetical protein